MIHDRRLRRTKRIRAKLADNPNLPRLSVFRSNRHIWAQIIDDRRGKTLAASSSKAITAKGTKTEQAALVGKQIAADALKKDIKLVKFDRGPYRYHGRVKALGEAAREAGLKF